jgi:hypothetical protein
VHTQPRDTLPDDFVRPKSKRPLTEGQVHFMRKVTAQRTVSILNLDWAVLKATPDQGVWATLKFSVKGATLRIFDAAPDAQQRVCRAEHAFPLAETVHPLRPEFQRDGENHSLIQRLINASRRIIEQVNAQWPFFDVLMARLFVKEPWFSSMS